MDYRTIALEKIAAQTPSRFTIQSYGYNSDPITNTNGNLTSVAGLTPSPNSAAQSMGNYVSRIINMLGGQKWFQKRVGDGSERRGLLRINDAFSKPVPLVNEQPGRTAAGDPAAGASYTGGSLDYMGFPASQFTERGTAGGNSRWGIKGQNVGVKGLTFHEAFHVFTLRLKNYIKKIEDAQKRFGIDTSKDSYHRSPKEQAAELNTVRALKGAWPRTDRPYTPDEAEKILNNENPYFKGLPPEYKAWLLNNVKGNQRGPVTLSPQTTVLA